MKKTNYLPLKLYAGKVKYKAKKGSVTIRLASVLKGSAVGVELFLEGDSTNIGDIGTEGTWPFKRYSTVKERLAAADNPEHSEWATDLETKKCFQFDEPTKTWAGPIQRLEYYLENMIPINAKRTIIALSKDKKTITLDKPLAVEVTNGTAYYNNTKEVARVIQMPGNVNFPAGDFAIDVFEIKNKAGNIVKGAGVDKTTFFSPMGFHSASFQATGNCLGLETYDYSIRGNNKNNGFGFQSEFNSLYPENSLPKKGWGDNPFKFTVAFGMFTPGIKFHHIKLINPLGYGFQEMGKDVWGEDLEVVLEDGNHGYTGWIGFHAYGAHNSGFKRCKFWSKNVTNCFESFDGFASFEDMHITNGIFAHNSSPAYLRNIYIELTEGAYTQSSPQGPVGDFNQFITGDKEGTGFDIDGLTIVNKDRHVWCNGLKGRDGTKNFKIKNFYFEQADQLDQHGFYYALQIPTEGAELENVTIEGKAPPAYDQIHTEPNHAIIGLVGPGKASLKSVKAYTIAVGGEVVVDKVEAAIFNKA